MNCYIEEYQENDNVVKLFRYISSQGSLQNFVYFLWFLPNFLWSLKWFLELNRFQKLHENPKLADGPFSTCSRPWGGRAACLEWSCPKPLTAGRPKAASCAGACSGGGHHAPGAGGGVAPRDSPVDRALFGVCGENEQCWGSPPGKVLSVGAHQRRLAAFRWGTTA
jgi:hypothetical protein